METDDDWMHSVGWCDVEMASPPRQRQPKDEVVLLPRRPTNLAAAYDVQKQNDDNKVEMDDDKEEEVEEDSEIETHRMEEFLRRFTIRVQERKHRQADAATGPLTAEELTELGIRAGRDAIDFPKVDSEVLTNVTEWLHEHVSNVCATSILDDAARDFDNKSDDPPSEVVQTAEQWLMANGKNQVDGLKKGIDAASILLRIAPQVDGTVIHMEILEDTIKLFRLHLMKHIVLSWNQTGSASRTPAVRDEAAAATAAAETPNNKKTTTPRKRRRSVSTPHSTTNSIVAKQWKTLYKRLLSSIPAFLVLMERLQVVLEAKEVTNVSLEDEQILNLTYAATASLEMDCQIQSSVNSPTNMTPLGIYTALGQQIQVSSINLITTAFGRYKDHRNEILEQILGILLRTPSGKRSLRAFEIRYTSALTPQALARRNAEWVGELLNKTCPLDKHLPHRIQMITVLLLKIMQKTVVLSRPVYETVQIDDGGQVTERLQLTSGLGLCHAVADFVARRLLKQCNEKDSSGAASEYRPILNNLVDDLLVVSMIPEYPAAQVMLMAIVKKIQEDLIIARSKAQNFETTYLNTAFDVLGRINAVSAQLLARHRERPIEMQLTPAPLEEQALVYNCYCGTTREEALILRCDNCQLCFHGSCVGANRETLPDDWMCDACRLGSIAKRERLNFGDNRDIPFIMDDVYAMRQSFLATLSHRTGVEGLEPAIAFHLAHWADELESKFGKQAQAATRVVVHGILDCWSNGFSVDMIAGEALTEEGGIRVILALLAKTSRLLQTFLDQLAFLIGLLMDDVPPALRKLSVKAIERTVEGDPQLMSHPKVTKAVSRRLTDENISVRDAAVSLVGSYVVKFPSVTKAYHASLVKCLSDVGVSVRKRAVKTFLEVLTADPFYDARAEVFDILLQRAADRKEEDSVRDLIHEVLTKLWLQDGGQIVEPVRLSPRNSAAATDPAPIGIILDSQTTTHSVVTPTPGPPQYKSQTRAHLAAQQMTEVVRTGGTSVKLETVLKKLLASSDLDAVNGPRGNGRKKEPKFVDSRQFDCLVDSLFEILLNIEEREPQLDHRKGKDLVAALQTIAVLADVSPQSVHRHLEVVHPYLKGENSKSKEDDSLIVAAVCDILSRISTVLNEDDLGRLSSETSVPKDLVNIAYNYPPCAFSAAVRALSLLAHHQKHVNELGDFPKKLLGMVVTFYKVLVKHKDKTDFSKVPDKIRNNTRRALSVLGLVCQYGTCSTSEGATDDADDNDDDEPRDENLVDASKLTWSNLTPACYRLFKIYFEKLDYVTKCTALQSLGSCFMVMPRMMIDLEQTGFITALLAPDADASLQIEALSSWRKILIAEEKRIDGGYATKKMEQDQNITVSKRISGDQDGDSNIFGGILTSYADSIFRMTRSRDNHVRLAAVELLEVIMRQGLANPNDAVPHLFALQGDVENPDIRSLACALLVAEGEKRPDTLRRRINAGVKEAFEFQRVLRSGEGERVSALLPPENSHQKSQSIFDVVYCTCLAANKKERKGVLKSLVKLFELEDLLDEDKCPKLGKNLALLGFAAEILAYLPYSFASDPLVIICHIKSLVSLQGEALIDRLADVLRPVGLASDDKFDDRNAAEDALEQAAKSKFPSKTPEAAFLTTKEFDMTKFAQLCQSAAAMILLLRLKRYLRQVYGLSETRCLEFDPADNSKKEQPVHKNDTKALFDATVVNTKDLNSLIATYAEFRHLMREESAITSTIGDDAEDDQDPSSSDDAPAKVSGKRKRNHSS